MLNPQLDYHALNYDSWLWSVIASEGRRYPEQSRDLLKVEGNDSSIIGRDFGAADFGSPAYGKHQSVFNLVYGSYVADWDWQNSTLRSILAESDGFGLASAFGQYWNTSGMAVGETIGARLLFAQAAGLTETALMGDPTLRQDAVKPVSNVVVTSSPSGNQLTWLDSPDPQARSYHVYRATNSNGPWELRTTNGPVAGITFVDGGVNGATNTDGLYYMVRANKLETTPSGSYYNLSTGVVSRPGITSMEFDWDGHVPDAQNPWKQWIDVKFTQEVNLTPANAASLLHIFGEEYDSESGTLVPRTLVYGVDYKLIADPAARTKRIVFLNPSNPAQPGQSRNGVWSLRVSRNVANTFGQSTGFSFDPGYDYFFLIADADYDGDVDFADQVVLAQHYDQPTEDPEHPRQSGDFDNDGDVDFQDLVLLAQLYGYSLPS